MGLFCDAASDNRAPSLHSAILPGKLRAKDVVRSWLRICANITHIMAVTGVKSEYVNQMKAEKDNLDPSVFVHASRLLAEGM